MKKPNRYRRKPAPKSKASHSKRSTKGMSKQEPTIGQKAVELTAFGLKGNPFTILLKLFKKDGMEEAREAIWEEGEFIASKIQLNILQQLLPMAPLSQRYAEWKAKNEKDPRILISEGDYVSEIKARKKAGGMMVKVGLPDAKHPSSGMPYEKLGRIHEYGTRNGNIPARPHWRPTIAWWSKKRKARVMQEIQDRVNEKVWKRLERYVGHGNKKKLTK